MSLSASHSIPACWGDWVKRSSCETGHGLGVPLTFAAESVPVPRGQQESPLLEFFHCCLCCGICRCFSHSQRQGQGSNLQLVLGGMAYPCWAVLSTLLYTSIGSFWRRPALVHAVTQEMEVIAKCLHSHCLVTSEQTWCWGSISVWASGAPFQDVGSKP